MSVPAEAAIRAWVNAQPRLVGEGSPLALGAYLAQQRSPDAGAYAVLARVPGGGGLVAEPAPELQAARITAQVYAGTEEAAEAAAAAYASAVEGLAGMPQPCGDTGVTVLVSANLAGPVFVPQPGDTGEQFRFDVDADFVITQ